MATIALPTTVATVTSPVRKRLRPEDPDFVELAHLINEAGLMETNRLYYTGNFVIRIASLAFSIWLPFTFESLWVQLLLTPVLLAVAFTQLGFLGHDSGHNQIFKSAGRGNYLFGLLINLLIGLSRSWWIDNHNEHHRNPNDLNLDPHTKIPGTAFSRKKAQEKHGPLGRLVGYQAYYFLPMLLLQGLGAKLASLQYLISGGVKKNALELSVMVLHLGLYCSLIFWTLGLGHGIIFIIVHQAAFGLYMGSVFAPNHKGMPTMVGEEVGFLRLQVLTSRNIIGGFVTDIVYGGLNYQIEHHLFQRMARCNLRKAQPIVQAFCEEKGIPYRLSSVAGSTVEIFHSLHHESAPLREAA